MQMYVGTSGFSYKEWKGPFYPKDLPNKDMLRYYGARLPAVEINNTFYRMPNEGTLIAWAEMVPSNFRFVLKAPRRITHIKPLVDKSADIRYLFETAEALGDKLGAILFQLPPFLHKNTTLLETFLDNLPPGARAVLEFRHPSWFDADVYTLLGAKKCALCCSDTENEELVKFVATTDWGYLRLRRSNYAENELKAWAEKISGLNWRSVYAFFKHEDAGRGPELAQLFSELALDL